MDASKPPLSARGVVTAAEQPPEPPPTSGDLKHKLIRGGIALAILLVVAAGLLALLPGLSGVREGISDASPGWLVAAAGVQLAAIVGAVLFVQLVFADEPHRLTWKMGGAQQAANGVMPTAGSTAVGYWTLSSVGWGARRFAERTAVMIIAPAVPNFLLIVLLGLGMALHVFSGPSDWWLTWLPAGICLVVMVVAVWAARWGHRLAARTKHKWLREGLNVVATGVTGTVEVLRERSWRVAGTFIDVLGAVCAFWFCLFAVGEHLPFAAVAMGFLVAQLAQAIPVPGGVGAIDAGIVGFVVLYGGEASATAAGEVIAHGLALIIPLVAGAFAFALLPAEIKRTRRSRAGGTTPTISPTLGSG